MAAWNFVKCSRTVNQNFVKAIVLVDMSFLPDTYISHMNFMCIVFDVIYVFDACV